MKRTEQYRQILNRYYERDENARDEYTDFITENSVQKMKMLFKSLACIEKAFNIKLPEEYKNFIKAACSWGLAGESNEFRVYDEEEMYEFNCIGSHVGYSSIEEMKDYFLFGQDLGEKSYFFDVFNTLGFGTEVVWRIDRSSCRKQDFEFVAKDFLELVEKFCDKQDEEYLYPFKNETCAVLRKPINVLHPFEKEPISGNNKTFFIKKLCEQMSADELYITSNKIGVSKNYLSEIKRRNDVRFISTEYRNQHIESLIKLQNIMNDAFPASFAFLLLHLDDFSFYQEKIFFLLLLDEQLEALNIGKKSKTCLKNMFIFACNSYSLFSKINGSYVDYFFIDPTNKLGKGPDAIYMISEKSKKLAEACYVAKDIVDFFRIFAEGKELSTTPIGTIPGE